MRASSPRAMVSAECVSRQLGGDVYALADSTVPSWIGVQGLQTRGGGQMPSPQEDWDDRGRARRYAKWSSLTTILVHRPFARRIAAAGLPMKAGVTVVDLGCGLPGLDASRPLAWEMGPSTR
jgi:hypothetical protein